MSSIAASTNVRTLSYDDLGEPASSLCAPVEYEKLLFRFGEDEWMHVA